MGEGRTRRGWTRSGVGFQRSALCFVLLLTSSILTAATWCTIEVGVGDGRNRPLGEVDVSAEASVLTENRTLVTEADGTAVLLGLPAGVYRMEISLVGYQWLEVQDVRCEPGSVVRLSVTLEETKGEEVVVLPSGPSVNPESFAVGRLVARQALDLLPRQDATQGESAVGPPSQTEEGFLPVEAVAFEGLVGAGSSGDPVPAMVVVPRRAGSGVEGRASLDFGAGSKAEATGTRGEAVSLEEAFRAGLSLGGTTGDGVLGAFLALEINDGGQDGRVVVDQDVPAGEVRRRRQWDRQSVLAYGSLGWRPAPGNSVDLGLSLGRDHLADVPSSLHLAPEAPAPVGDRKHTVHAVELGWDVLVSDSLFVKVGGRLSGVTRAWDPKSSGVMEQDRSPDGTWSEGRGNGIWAGDGGVAAFDQTVDALRAEAGLEWSAGSGHRVAFETSWVRKDLEFEYGERGDLVALGERRTHEGSIATRRDILVPSEISRGVEESQRLAVRDHWRVGSDVTVLLGLEASIFDFDVSGRGLGYTIGLEKTLSPRVGLVWDFEGSGRSRAWVRWARSPQGPGEVVRWRMTGALDIETLFVDDDGSSWERSPGSMSVASDLEPGVIDETVFGVEYELLSHLSVGAAGAVRRTRDHLAILSEDGGRTFSLDTPLGEVWPERLAGESLESWAWLRKRLANGWQAEILIGWRRSRGTWPGSSFFDPADLDREYLADVLSPAALEGAWGPLPDDRRWRLEMGGSWLFDAGLSVGGRLTYRSGAPVSQMGSLADGFGLDRRFVDTRGSAGRSPELWRLDLVGSWPFPFGGGQLELIAELSHLLGSQTAVGLDQRWTVLDEVQAESLNADEQWTNSTWREPLTVQQPMELTVGLRYSW